MPTSPPGSCLGYLGPLAGLQRGCMGQREKDILARGSNSFRRAQNDSGRQTGATSPVGAGTCDAKTPG